MKAYAIRDIAAALGAEAHGETGIEITSLAEPADARADQLAMAIKPEFAARIGDGAARAAMLPEGADWRALGLAAAITAPRPRYALSGLSAMMDPGQGWSEGIHPTAFVDPDAKLERGVCIGPLAVVLAGAEIGTGTVIGPQCFIGHEARIGAMCFLREGVRVAARVSLGDRVIVQPGASIGGDGYSFVTPERNAVDEARESLGTSAPSETVATGQSWARIHSLGGVEIGDDVEIGANACIDRGTIRDTRVGAGTKIDNLAQIGHNVVIGTDCMICAQVGIAGSSVIGNNVILGGQTGISDNLTVGDNVVTGGATKVLSSIPAGRVMLGYPAMKMATHIESYKAIRRLPRLLREVAALKKMVQDSDPRD
ncbi:UDP-3-O-(3-hydroxymyristoyl)glucosamine N-acyltransferase [Poseidonocella sedimentorum]|uniref:UDP-3-O-acylglucosamine N-acyltransferase n=1 Tax=Poseidonocella sedimentorum TaxID=871652 RepID=A0A1I6EH58_9RHOB|nr:UDP-3-O-(3-hydroxymyristoyl)glucosamine N-acyltransferase [Poseidonocella sedimentorum]SFR17045.1 UDP-3-O-[3-hydroxymyristoyl] glucosamine N-acyltransferase [Poseidonocella sedimentorum]